MEKIHHLYQGLLGLVFSGYVLEGDTRFFLHIYLRIASPHRKRTIFPHSAEQQGQQSPHEKDGKNIDGKKIEDRRGGVRHLSLHLNALFQTSSRERRLVLRHAGDQPLQFSLIDLLFQIQKLLLTLGQGPLLFVL